MHTALCLRPVVFLQRTHDDTRTLRDKQPSVILQSPECNHSLYPTLRLALYHHECEGDFTGNAANFSTATEEDLSIVCGSCATSESTPQPAASTLSPLTPTPVSPISRGTSAPIAPPTTPSTAESTPTPSVRERTELNPEYKKR